MLFYVLCHLGNSTVNVTGEYTRLHTLMYTWYWHHALARSAIYIPRSIQSSIMKVMAHVKYIWHTMTSLASHMVSVTYSSAYTHSACTALTCTKSASQFAPCCTNIHSESVLCCWVKVVNQHTGISGVDHVDSTCNSSNL